MNKFSTSLMQPLTDAIMALRSDAGVLVLLRASDGALSEHLRSGNEEALAKLPTEGWSNADDVRTADGWRVMRIPLRRHLPSRQSPSLGDVYLAAPDDITAPIIDAIRAVASQTSLALEQNELHQELQHSFNGLFIVYEAGQLLNFTHTPDDVVSHVISVLSKTLHFSHCAVMLLQNDGLIPAAQHGLSPEWLAAAQLPFDKTFLAHVVRSGDTVQWGEGDVLDEVALPILSDGSRPARILCAPLTTRAGTLGALEVYWPADGELVADDALFVVSVLAVEMAAALENAHLYEELREREERLTQYTAKLVNSQEEERRRISRDIHDGLGQMIVSAFQYFQAHEFTLPPEHPKETFAHGLDALQECVKETRRVMSDLRPSTLDDFGLVVALQQQLEAIAKEAHWDARFKVAGSVPRLGPIVETTVFRVVQEALNNVRKHAHAGRVQVTLSGREGEVTVDVRDWGDGFETSDVTARPERGEHLGLMGMRERAALLGGAVRVSSSLGKGTTVKIILPVRE